MSKTCRPQWSVGRSGGGAVRLLHSTPLHHTSHHSLARSLHIAAHSRLVRWDARYALSATKTCARKGAKTKRSSRRTMRDSSNKPTNYTPSPTPTARDKPSTTAHPDAPRSEEKKRQPQEWQPDQRKKKSGARSCHACLVLTARQQPWRRTTHSACVGESTKRRRRRKNEAWQQRRHSGGQP